MFGKFCVRVFVGLIAATVVSLGKVLPVIFLTVVCTAGAGLLVVLPAAYLIGLLVTIWFVPFGAGEWSYDGPGVTGTSHRVEGKEKPPAPYIPRDASRETDGYKEEHMAPTSQRNRRALLANNLAVYITNALKTGISWETIRAELGKCGWSDSTIDAAYATAREQTPKPETP